MRKMLKHDLNSVWRIWRIMAPVMLVSAMACGFIIPLSKMMGFETIDALSLWAIQLVPFFGPLASVVYLAANPFAWISSQFMNTLPIVFFIVTLVLILIRYYKNFFTDEGYLTFTLPVSRKALLNSKVFMAFFWMAMTVLVCVVAYILYGLCSTDAEFWQRFVEYFSESGSDVPNDTPSDVDWSGFWSAICYFVSYLSLAAVFVLSNFMMMLTSITVGATIVKRAKLILGLGIYIVTTYVMSAVSFFLIFISVDFLADSYIIDLNHWLGCGTVWLGILLFAGLGVGAYILNLKLIQNKLNLP